MLQNIRIVLVNTSHPGNIGAVARAMKNMGLSRLTLVSPEEFPHGQATARAAGADDILQKAVIVDNLPEALVDCDLVFGTSARPRTLSWSVCDPRECAKEVLKHSEKGEVAIVFGRESSGLTNEELSHCQRHVFIPTASPDFSSLNLAAAVQVIVYEILITSLNKEDKTNFEETRELATADQMNGFYEHLEQTLEDLKFLDPKQPKMLMYRLKRLFGRAQVDTTEINILRGILSAVDWQVRRSK